MSHIPWPDELYMGGASRYSVTYGLIGESRSPYVFGVSRSTSSGVMLYMKVLLICFFLTPHSSLSPARLTQGEKDRESVYPLSPLPRAQGQVWLSLANPWAASVRVGKSPHPPSHKTTNDFFALAKISHGPYLGTQSASNELMMNFI